MTITVLCTAEHPDQVMKNGPLARVFEDMRNLAQRLSRLEDELNQVKWNQQRVRTEPYTPTAPYQSPGTYPSGPRWDTYPNGPGGLPTTGDPFPPSITWGSSSSNIDSIRELLDKKDLG